MSLPFSNMPKITAINIELIFVHLKAVDDGGI